MKKFAVVALVFALVSGFSPAPAEEPTPAEIIAQSPNRYTAREVGKPTDMSLVFGPYHIPPGQDSNRITLDLPLNQGFITAIAPRLINARTGEMPSMQEAHIHHAHWFRVTNDPEQEYYTGYGNAGLSWVFGTGEEATQGRMDDRARLDQAAGNNWDYGMKVDATTPQAVIYMIHNKTANPETFIVTLDITFIPGTREEIKEATGLDIHPLYGQLWGQTKDVTYDSKNIGDDWEVTHDGVAVAAAGHLHPGGKATIISNLGQRQKNGKSACENAEAKKAGAGDPDGDGFLGVTLLDSYRYDRVMEAWPYSENYQMGASKFGWRAPLHKGDVLRQEATYALDAKGDRSPLGRGSINGDQHHWYEAMTYTGIYMDREYTGLKTPAGVCSFEALRPRLLGEDNFETQGLSAWWTDKNAHATHGDGLKAGIAELKEDWNRFLPRDASQHDRIKHGMVNHLWHGDPEPLCALKGMPGLVSYPKCGPKDIETTAGPATNQIHVAGFTYVPGDLNVATGGAVALPQVSKGAPLEFVNEDVVANVRHTFTSCAWPCVGTYVSNFPLPTGGPQAFDTGKIGNLDPIDGGITGDDTLPHNTLDTAEMDPGKYAYFCRIHPWMRGGFELVE